MADEPTIGAFSVQDARDLLGLLRYARQAGWLTQAGQKTPLIADAPRCYIAYVTTTITARSGTTAGKGKATLRSIPGVAGTATAISNFPDPSGTAVEIDVYNVASSSVASGKYIFVNREYGSGKWVVVVEDCG
jgi:hypothetical protein